jgi:multisubunit Na+/H+ antiporter MnhE subunit
MPRPSRDKRPTRLWPRAASALLEILWWWAASVAIWALTLSSVSNPELVAAACCGLPCALAARAGRKAIGARWRPRPRWAAWLLPLLVAIPADAGRLAALTIRQLVTREDVGSLRRIRLPADEPPDVAAARHAAATLIVSAMPGTFITDSDPGEGTLVIHTLVSGWPRLEQVVRR